MTAKKKVRRPGGNTTAARAKKAEVAEQTRLRNREAMEQAKTTIEAEFKANGGKYLHNKGRISVAEIVRRADLHEGTINKKGYKDLRKPYKDWVSALCETVKAEAPMRPKRRRRTADERAMAWKAQYEYALEQLRIAEVELMYRDMVAESDLAEKKVSPRAANVVPFPG